MATNVSVTGSSAPYSLGSLGGPYTAAVDFTFTNNITSPLGGSVCVYWQYVVGSNSTTGNTGSINNGSTSGTVTIPPTGYALGGCVTFVALASSTAGNPCHIIHVGS